jgi:hypothetical protein
MVEVVSNGLRSGIRREVMNANEEICAINSGELDPHTQSNVPSLRLQEL